MNKQCYELIVEKFIYNLSLKTKPPAARAHSPQPQPRPRLPDFQPPRPPQNGRDPDLTRRNRPNPYLTRCIGSKVVKILSLRVRCGFLHAQNYVNASIPKDQLNNISVFMFVIFIFVKIPDAILFNHVLLVSTLQTCHFR